MDTAKSICEKYGNSAGSVIAQATGQSRHENRVEATLQSARNWLKNANLCITNVHLAFLLILDINGVGGPFGSGGPEGGTARILSDLGKGRWRASDGAAYKVAALQTLTNVEPGPISLKACGSTIAIRLGLENWQEIELTSYAKSTNFIDALCRRAILALAEETAAKWSLEVLPNVFVCGTCSDWGSTLDFIHCLPR